MTTPTTQALREAVEKALNLWVDDQFRDTATTEIIEAIQPLLAPAASEPTLHGRLISVGIHRIFERDEIVELTGAFVVCSVETLRSMKENLVYEDVVVSKAKAGAPAASEREKALEAFVEDVSKQRPGKPDHWTSCGQCEGNISDAKDLLSARSAPTVSDDTRRLDWLEKQYANIYVHKVEGSNDSKSPTYCWCGPKIRQAIDSAMTGAKGGGK